MLERLRPGDFYRPAHQNIYDAILDLYGRGERRLSRPPPSWTAATCCAAARPICTR